MNPQNEPEMNPIDDLGKLGENLVAEWVVSKRGQVLATRWHCPFGEIDVVALNPDGDLIFIEVKTRSPRNIDEDGVLAVTRTKQRKLIQSAKLFQLKHPLHHTRNCRFDIALVRARSPQSNQDPNRSPNRSHPIGFNRTIGSYDLTLVNYIINAFDTQR